MIRGEMIVGRNDTGAELHGNLDFSLFLKRFSNEIAPITAAFETLSTTTGNTQRFTIRCDRGQSQVKSPLASKCNKMCKQQQ
jgi:hypothetical protein